MFSPKFIFEKMLHLPFNVFQVRFVQQLTGKSERTVYDWFSRGKMGKTSEYRDLMTKLSENKDCLWCPINSSEFIRIIKDPAWGEFAYTWLLNKDNDFRSTMHHLIFNQAENIKVNGWEGSLHKLSSCLPFDFLRKVSEDLGKKGLRRDRVEDITEILAFIMILVHLESEYCESMQMESLFLERFLPEHSNRETCSVSLPTEQFMARLPDNLVEMGVFKNRAACAYYIGSQTKLYDHVLRYFNRYRAGEAAPSWATFTNFVREIAIIFFEQQDIKNGDEVSSEESRSREDDMILCLQNIYGGVLLLEGAFRVSHQALAGAGFDPVSFFREEYFAYARRIKNRRTVEPFSCG